MLQVFGGRGITKTGLKATFIVDLSAIYVFH